MAEKILKSLILVENAAKARTLRRFAGRNYSVLSTDGFLRNLPRSRIGISDDYQPNYITVRGKGPLLAELRRETLKARRIFLATNPDAQGEFLARQCCEIFGVNPNSHFRLWMNELTRETFKTALAEAQSLNENLASSFEAKQIIDKYVSHQVGEFLACKIWRGVKVGRFRGMLLKFIAETPTKKILTIGEKLTPATLQKLALHELNYSPARTRLIADQLYDGVTLGRSGRAGLITYPHAAEIFLTGERRTPEAVQKFLTEYQFKLYNLIYTRLTEKISPAQIELDATTNDATIIARLDECGVDWADFYAAGVASLLKRKYIAAENSCYEITALGNRVLESVEEFFDEPFSAEAYNVVAAKLDEIAEGTVQKSNVLENYCGMFDVSFTEAMESLGEDAQPIDEPVVESDEVCEKCGKKMLIRRGRYGTFLACSGYPECKNAKPYLEPTDKKCPKCKGQLAKRSLNNGRNFYCCKACDFTTWDEPQSISCKTCGTTLLLHRFKERSPMLYCGNENCPTRENHPINKILNAIKRRVESRRKRKADTTEAEA